jgi:hypothetical protein
MVILMVSMYDTGNIAVKMDEVNLRAETATYPTESRMRFEAVVDAAVADPGTAQWYLNRHTGEPTVVVAYDMMEITRQLTGFTLNPQSN